MHAIFDWFLTVTGSNNTSGIWYGFWSGFGSDLGEVALIGGVITLYKQHKCESCWRFAKHHIKGTHYQTCHVHLTDHDKLKEKHRRKFPAQHKILNEEE
jgi:hypothetical protein